MPILPTLAPQGEWELSLLVEEEEVFKDQNLPKQRFWGVYSVLYTFADI